MPLLLAVLLAAVPAFSAGSNSGRSSRGKTSGPPVTGIPVLNTGLNPGQTAPTLSAPALNLGLNPSVDLSGHKAQVDGVNALQKAGVPAQTALAINAEASEDGTAAARRRDAATLMAKVAENSKISPRQRILLIAAAARTEGAALSALQQLHGFTQDQTAALSKFASDPAGAQAAAEAAFEGAELEWALLWGPRLAFVEKIAPFTGSAEAAELHLKAVASESGRDVEVLRREAADSLAVLMGADEVNLLPMQEAGNLTLTAWHFKEVKESGKPAPKQRGGAKLDAGVVDKAGKEAGKLDRGVDAEAQADLDAARRYVRGIMGKRVPTEREADSLLLDFMEMKGIEAGSGRARALRAGFLPSLVQAENAKLAGLSPALRSYDKVILAVSEEKGIPVAELEAFIKEQGIAGPSTTPEMMDRVLRNYAERQVLEAAVADYPDTEQGQVMRDVASTMLARGGKSVEEIARDGVFLYVNYAAGQVKNASVGRDPDPTAPHMIFYVTRPDKKWKIAGYRNNRPLGRSDSALISDLVKWLEKGGVPSSDFLN